MRMGTYNGYVGVFDSGLGGTSVLAALVRELPHENFVYYGDSAHNPYGEKTTQEVRDLSGSIVSGLLESGCKAIVIACNTATSAAAETLRHEYPEVPIIGVEPALKPAALAVHGGRVLVMATPMTVRLDKFQHLMQTWGGEAEVIAVPCEGLAARVERGNLQAQDVLDLLQSLVGEYVGTVDAVVLGCTHYPFVREQIRAVVGDVPFFDGAEGTARQLRKRLTECGLLNHDEGGGEVVFCSSDPSPQTVAAYRDFFARA